MDTTFNFNLLGNVPKFSGTTAENPIKWKNEILQLIDMIPTGGAGDDNFTLQLKRKIYIFGQGLTGSAKAWYMSLPDYDISSMDRLWNAFDQKYIYGCSKYLATLSLHKRKQKVDENVEVYAYELWELMSLVDPDMTVEARITQFILGLHENVQKGLLDKSFDSWDDAVQAAARREIMLEFHKSSQSNDSAGVKRKRSMDETESQSTEKSAVKEIINRLNDIETKVRKISENKQQQKSNYVSPGRNFKQMRPYNNQHQFNIHSPNRFSSNNFNSRSRTHDGRPICWNCGKPGHVQRVCQNMNAKQLVLKEEMKSVNSSASPVKRE